MAGINESAPTTNYSWNSQGKAFGNSKVGAKTIIMILKVPKCMPRHVLVDTTLLDIQSYYQAFPGIYICMYDLYIYSILYTAIQVF